jgi:hypothetical protein
MEEAFKRRRTASVKACRIGQLSQLVMTALEAAIQSYRDATVRRRVWMAGSAPGHDEREEL